MTQETERELFEKDYAPHQLILTTNGHYAGQYQSSSIERDWQIFRRGYAARARVGKGEV